MSKNTILKKYVFCVGNQCEHNNNILVKKVFLDLNNIPLCVSCRYRTLRNIRMLQKGRISLSDEEIKNEYLNRLYKD